MKKIKFNRPGSRPGIAATLMASSCLVLCATPTIAAPDDVFQPYIATTYTHYDNLFLIPNDQPANEPGVDPARSDSSEQIEAGILYNQPIGLQNVTAQAKLNKNYFNHFNELNYTGHDLLAAWSWKISQVLEGKIGATDTKTMGSYADFHSQVRNLFTERRQFANLDWKISPHWRVHTGVSRDSSTYDATTQQFNNNTEKSNELGLDYLFLREGSVGFLFNHTTGDFPNQFISAGQDINNSYSENGYNAKLDWHITGKTQLIFVGGWVKRTTDIAQDNVNGFNGRMNVNWQPTGKTELNLAAWRQYEPSLTGIAGFSLNTGIGADITWNATSKIHVISRLKYEKRNFSSFATGAQALSYDDATNRASLLVKYEPRQFLQLTAGLSHALRSASIPLGGYVGNEATVSGSMKF